MASKRVLIVDDQAVIRGFVKVALRDLNVVVHEASDGSQALEMQDVFPADVILCDVTMPGINGEQFLERLRERGDQTPVIMLTAEADKTLVRRLMELGIQGYVLKPFKPGVLCDRVVEALRGQIPAAPAADPEDAPSADAASEEQPNG